MFGNTFMWLDSPINDGSSEYHKRYAVMTLLSVTQAAPKQPSKSQT